MPMVKALREHGNPYGDKYDKAVGDTYKVDAQHARVLVDRKIVEIIDDGEADGLSGTGTGAGGAAEDDGQERPAKGRKASAGTDAGKGGESGAA